MKKSVYLLVGIGMVSWVLGCASTPLTVAPVGPNPSGTESAAAKGGLRVFSSLVGRSEGDNPPWYQHTDYSVYDLQGKLVKRVHNTVGHYAQAPRRVILPVGRYLVKAQANDYFRVSVPVTIKRGQTTSIHLDDNWKLPADTPRTELVSLPDGQPVGWQADPVKEIGIN